MSDQELMLGKLSHSAHGLRTLDAIVMTGYLFVLIAMGFWFARREVDSLDYFCAGRRIPWWAAGISLLGTSVSAITFMAIPAMSYRTDWVYLPGNLMIVAVTPVIIWYYLPFFRRLQVTSAYEYLELRFGLATRLVGSATFVLFQIGRISVVIYLPALALSAVTGWNAFACIVVMGLVATLYTTMGGIEAVIWTDVLQVFVLFCGALLSCAMIITRFPGGIEGMFSVAQSEGKLRAANMTWSATSSGLWVVVLGNFFRFLIPYSSDQAVIQRYLTTRDERQAARSIWLNAVASVPTWTLFFALGTMLWAFYSAFPHKLDPVGRTDEIFAWFIVNELPAGIAGLVITALFAACMSSLDSSLNSLATAVTTDFYHRLFRKNHGGTTDHDTEKAGQGDRSNLLFAQCVTIVLGMIGTGTAALLVWLDTRSIWDYFLSLVGLMGGGLAGLFVAGLFTRRTHQTGVLIGFVVSAVVLLLISTYTSIHFFLFGGIGILTCAIAGWIASWILPASTRPIAGLTVFDLRQQQLV